MWILQMVDGHTLFDYNVGLNEIVQILIKATAPIVTEASADAEDGSADKIDSNVIDETPEVGFQTVLMNF